MRGKIDKPYLDSPRKREDSNTIKSERGDITTDVTEIQRVIRNYHEQLYAKKFENLGEMDNFQKNIIFQT